MRFCIFIRSFDGGGAQRAMIRYASGMARLGHGVDVVTLIPNGPYRSELDARVNIIDISAKRLAFAIVPLAAHLRATAPDVLLVTESACSFIAFLSRSICGKRPMLVIREGLFPSVAIREATYRVTRISYRFAKFFYKRADLIIALTQHIADDLVENFGVQKNRVGVISVNPVVTDELLAAAQVKAKHPWFASDVPVVLGVGRLEEQKDFETLLRAFALANARRNCRLVIIGEGSERKRLEACASRLGVASDVDFVGFDPNPFPYMANCSVYVLSSRFEGLPNSVIEALACGANVVSTDCPSGPRDLLDAGKFGELVPVGGVEAMALAIEKVLDQPLPRIHQLNRGLEYTVDRSVALYLELIGERWNRRPA